MSGRSSLFSAQPLAPLSSLLVGIMLTLLTLSLAAPAQAACRQALALGLDVSGSVDAGEYQLQVNGLANALLHTDVQAALLQTPGGAVDLMVFEFSGPRDQHLLLGWRRIDSPAAIAAAAQQIRDAARVGGDPSTALGSALRFGVAQLQPRPCPKKVLDLAADGVANSGPLPQQARRAATAQGITVNGLIIADETTSGADRQPTSAAALREYFEANVLTGPMAFTEVALGFDAFEAAMVRKLIRELTGFELVRAARPPEATGVTLTEGSVDIADLVGPVTFDAAQRH